MVCVYRGLPQWFKRPGPRKGYWVHRAGGLRDRIRCDRPLIWLGSHIERATGLRAAELASWSVGSQYELGKAVRRGFAPKRTGLSGLGRMGRTVLGRTYIGVKGRAMVGWGYCYVVRALAPNQAIRTDDHCTWPPIMGVPLSSRVSYRKPCMDGPFNGPA